MSNNEYVTPVNHGVLSATGNVAVGTVGGAAKAVGKTTAWMMGLNVVAGALAGIALSAIGAAVITGSVAAAFTGLPLLLTGGVAVAGASSGVVSGLVESAFLAPIAALIGGGKGATQTLERVSQERAAAKMVDLQIETMRSKPASNDNRYNFAAQGSPMNPAMTSIQADTAQSLGTVNGQQLQRA